MLIETNDEFPQKMWYIGMPGRRVQRKLERSKEGNPRMDVLYGLMVALACGLGIYSGAVNKYLWSNQWYLALMVFLIQLIPLALLSLALYMLWLQLCYLLARWRIDQYVAAGTVVPSNAAAYQLFVASNDDDAACKKAIDAAILGYSTYREIAMAVYAEKEDYAQYWFLRGDMVEEWAVLKEAYVRQCAVIVPGWVSRLQDVELECANALRRLMDAESVHAHDAKQRADQMRNRDVLPDASV